MKKRYKKQNQKVESIVEERERKGNYLDYIDRDGKLTNLVEKAKVHVKELKRQEGNLKPTAISKELSKKNQAFDNSLSIEGEKEDASKL